MLASLLSHGERVKIGEAEWSQPALYIRGIELDPTCAIFHVNLAILIGPQDKVKFSGGLALDRCQLLLRAIQIDPGCALAYMNLGMLLPQGGKAQLACGSIKDKEEILAK